MRCRRGSWCGRNSGKGIGSKSILLATDDEGLYEYDGGHDDERHVLYEQSVCDVEYERDHADEQGRLGDVCCGFPAAYVYDLGDVVQGG